MERICKAADWKQMVKNTVNIIQEDIQFRSDRLTFSAAASASWSLPASNIFLICLTCDYETARLWLSKID